MNSWAFRSPFGNVQKSNGPFGLLLDYSMDFGAQKIFLILRFSFTVKQDQADLLQKDKVQVVGFSIGTPSTGQDIYSQLKDLICRIGIPSVILSDEGPDLKAGIRLLREEYPQIERISDITHKCSNLLKGEFKGHPHLNALVQIATQGSSALRLGCWSFLKAPKINSQLRILNLGRFIAWAYRLMEYMRVPGAAPRTLPWLS